jgi:hypothetical protein
MTPPGLDMPHQRALSDLLQAERSLREMNESVLRDMRQALLETAIRLDGERLEALRRTDPAIPSNWSPADWRKFFSQVSQGWGGAGTRETRLLQLEKQIESLKKKLAQAEARDAASPSPSQAIPSAPSLQTPIPSLSIAGLLPGAVPSLSALIADAQQVGQSLPQSASATFKKSLVNGGGRTGGDLPRAFQRYWILLYLVGHWRLTVSTELEDILSAVVDISAGSGSLRRLLGDLSEKSDIFVSETVKADSPSTSLKLFRLSAQGERLYQSLFNRRVNENEWSRLMRLRAGERHPGFTVAVLAFVSQARKRGWAAQVLPEGKDADAWVMRGDERWFVEIGLSDKERLSHWQSLAALNDGRLALCAADSKTRAQLVEMRKQAHLAGVATDIEALVMAKLKGVAENAPLWRESW